MKPLSAKRVLLICGTLAVVLLVSVLVALKLGAVPIPVSELALSLARKIVGAEVPADHQLIIFEMRLPRILLGILVGSALAVAGAGFQALLRNPLADPYVLGVSSGAALGAILSLVILPQVALASPVAAFLGAALAITTVYFLGRRGGQLDSSTLLLAGIITASFLSAVIMFLMTTLPSSHLRGMAFWLMGDLSVAPPVSLGFLFVTLAAAAAAIYTTGGDLNLMLTGEQEALHLGVEVNRVKLVVYLSASLLTGLAVSVSGAIGYVGLIVPHIMRMLFGHDHRLLIPTAALGGATAVVLADALARTIVAPTELPVGAMTAMAGAPMFIYLLRRRMR